MLFKLIKCLIYIVSTKRKFVNKSYDIIFINPRKYHIFLAQ